MPQFIGSGDAGMAQALLQAMPFTQAKDMLLTMANGTQHQLPETLEPRTVDDPED